MTKLTVARTNKTVSFSHMDDWEDGLYEYANNPARGKFGPYIKRLIARDRDGEQAQVSVKEVVRAEVAVVPKASGGDSLRAVASGFL